jgi:hypothetical protein
VAGKRLCLLDPAPDLRLARCTVGQVLAVDLSHLLGQVRGVPLPQLNDGVDASGFEQLGEVDNSRLQGGQAGAITLETEENLPSSRRLVRVGSFAENGVVFRICGIRGADPGSVAKIVATPWPRKTGLTVDTLDRPPPPRARPALGGARRETQRTCGLSRTRSRSCQTRPKRNSSRKSAKA